MADKKAVSAETNDETLDETLEETLVEDESAEGENTESEEIETEEETKEDEGEELTVSFGEGSPPSEDDEAKAPAWVKDLRKSNRELAKRNRELEERLKQSVPKEQTVEVGPKPTLEDCDFDGEEFEKRLLAWQERKQQAAKQVADRERQENEAKQAWNQTLVAYEEKAAKLKVKDFKDAEDTVKDNLSVTQQAIILDGCKDPALIVYALGKNPDEASRLAKITNPVKFAFEVARLEGKLKVSTKKAPPPERSVKRGGTSLAGATTQTLEQLRAEAAKTGDYSKVVQYKKQLKEKA